MAKSKKQKPAATRKAPQPKKYRPRREGNSLQFKALTPEEKDARLKQMIARVRAREVTEEDMRTLARQTIVAGPDAGNVQPTIFDVLHHGAFHARSERERRFCAQALIDAAFSEKRQPAMSAEPAPFPLDDPERARQFLSQKAHARAVIAATPITVTRLQPDETETTS